MCGSSPNMEDEGTTKMQVLHMAHVEGQNMDRSAFAMLMMAK